MSEHIIRLEVMERIGRDIRKAAVTMGAKQARHLVDAYYQMQDNRKRAASQELSMEDEPHAVVSWLKAQALSLENSVKSALGAYAKASELGVWAMSINGIGPVIAAGLLAHIDLVRADTVGKIWRFAGLDSTVRWAKQKQCKKWLNEQDTKDVNVLIVRACDYWGRKESTLRRLTVTDGKGNKRALSVDNLAKAIARRPWNGSLKTLCWKIGNSFVRASKSDNDIYGKLYYERKELETRRNEAGEFAEQAARIAKDRPDHKQIKTYKKGMLPDGHIDMRAKRYVAKLFLAHYHEKGRKIMGLPVPNPYPIDHLGHAHKIDPPA